jgi:hypothetical protein
MRPSADKCPPAVTFGLDLVEHARQFISHRDRLGRLSCRRGQAFDPANAMNELKETMVLRVSETRSLVYRHDRNAVSIPLCETGLRRLEYV